MERIREPVRVASSLRGAPFFDNTADQGWTLNRVETT